MLTLKPGETTVGFIGTGVMGNSMAKHLLQAGYELVVHNRTKERATGLLAEGAKWASTVGEVAQRASVVFTIVGFPSDVEEVYFGDGGLLASAQRGSYLVDMTTSSPALARRIAETAKERGLHALDAPVSGGDIGAREARLTIMVGGEERAFDELLPLFSVMGKNIILQGSSGAGQHTKMCNQIAIAAGMLGVCEALAYAKMSGLNPSRVLDSIGAGAAGSWSLSNYGPRMIEGNFNPGFYVKHFIKDMKIALDSASEMGLDVPGLELAKKMYERLADEGYAELGTHALYKLYTES